MKKGKEFQAYLDASTIGLHVIVAVAVGVVMGVYLDDWLGTKPVMVLIFAFFGLIAGVRNAIRAYRSVIKTLDEVDADDLNQKTSKTEKSDSSDTSNSKKDFHKSDQDSD